MIFKFYATGPRTGLLELKVYVTAPGYLVRSTARGTKGGVPRASNHAAPRGEFLGPVITPRPHPHVMPSRKSHAFRGM